MKNYLKFISPKIYYYDIKSKVYVIEKWTTLFEMLKIKIKICMAHLRKLTSLFKKYKQSASNILIYKMAYGSEKKDDFT